MLEKGVALEEVREINQLPPSHAEGSANDQHKSLLESDGNASPRISVQHGELESVLLVGVDSPLHLTNHLMAGPENDLIIGNDSVNFIGGGGGDDIIDGRGGADLLSGGTGADVFYYTYASEGGDYIIDFDPAEGDKIRLSLVGSNLDTGDIRILDFAGDKPQPYSVWYFQGKHKTHVFADTDGDLEAQEFVLTLYGSHNLEESDFYL